MTKLYNLVWTDSLPSKVELLPIAPFETNRVVVFDRPRAVILYPALMTPAIVRADDPSPWVELLLISASDRLTAGHVMRQLKVYEGLSPQKCYHDEALFTGAYGNVEIEPAEAESGGLLRTHERFAGMVHGGVRARLKQEGLTHTYRVRIHRHALENAADANRKIDAPAELSDRILTSVLKRLHGSTGYKVVPELGSYALHVGSDGPQLWDEPATETDEQKIPAKDAFRRADPVQSYHPVYLLDERSPAHLNFGHLTDIHVNSRLDILQQNPVRVVQGPKSSTTALDHSPSVADLIQPTNRSFWRLLNQMSAEPDAHAVLIGGDLIDHQLNAYSREKPAPRMEAVWDAVDLEKGKRQARYAAGVDMVAFYSMLLSFCRESQKPVFGVSGNHDCYLKPFGISPRGLGVVRANEGIPADVNLTFYEAALAFGPTWGDCEVNTGWNQPPSSFEAEWFEWYHTVFTPFADFSVRLGAQQLVCLGWGENEDMIAGGQQASPTSPGHLPRAEQALTALQLKLLEEATDHSDERRVIALTHFTVASFNDNIPLFNPTTGLPSRGLLGGHDAENAFCMGSFESNRDAFIELLAERKITCILSGHSHRRGLYFVDDLARSDLTLANLSAARLQPGSVQRSLPVVMHDPEGFEIPASQPLPALLTSDSAGTYPRYNRHGEFGGWGSDVPSGSVMTFDADGRPKRVKVLRAPEISPPRLAVAVDYLDLIVLEHDERGAVHIETLYMDAKREELLLSGKSVTGYTVRITLAPGLVSANVGVRTLFLHDSEAPAPLELAATSGREGRSVVEFTLSSEQSREFHRWVNGVPDVSRFVSVQLMWLKNAAAADERCTSQSMWNFEAIVQTVELLGQRRYVLRRPRRTLQGEAGGWAKLWPEVPDFAWRRRMPPSS